MKILVAVFALAAAPAWAAASGKTEWALEASTLSYKADHTLHKSQGTSHAAKGKGACGETGCKLLVAAPVSSFDSGDANRDAHMIETVRGATFPMVVVSVALPQEPAGDDFTADLDVEFAGHKAHYAGVPFHVTARAGDTLAFEGVVPMTLTGFKIAPPSLMGMAVKNDVPVKASMTWRRAAVH